MGRLGRVAGVRGREVLPARAGAARLSPPPPRSRGRRARSLFSVRRAPQWPECGRRSTGRRRRAAAGGGNPKPSSALNPPKASPLNPPQPSALLKLQASTLLKPQLPQPSTLLNPQPHKRKITQLIPTKNPSCVGSMSCGASAESSAPRLRIPTAILCHLERQETKSGSILAGAVAPCG